jgi:hypothetical protein
LQPAGPAAGLPDIWRPANFLREPAGFTLVSREFVGILVQREHRALHDLIAGTAVIYAWDARAARLRFLAREAEAGAGRSPRLPAGREGSDDQAGPGPASSGRSRVPGEECPTDPRRDTIRRG